MSVILIPTYMNLDFIDIRQSVAGGLVYVYLKTFRIVLERDNPKLKSLMKHQFFLTVETYFDKFTP